MSGDIYAKLAAMSQGGWDGIETGGEANAELADVRKAIEAQMRAEAMRQARIFADTFGTPAGRQCLELIRKKVFTPPTAEELDVSKLEAFALRQARLQGMQQLVWMIDAAMAEASGAETGETNG